MEIFGELERAVGELYPYRVPITLGVLAAVAALAIVAVRRNLHRRVARLVRSHPVASGVSLMVAASVVLPVGNYLISPLWERSTLQEASPLAAATAVNAQSTAASSAAAPSSTPDGAATTSATIEATAAAFAARVALEGEFMGADDFHFGEGRVLLIETAPDVYVLRFEDFSVQNGPDLFVYLSDDPAGYGEHVIKLGNLKATDGDFNYDIPAGIDVERFRSAIVWCDAFSVLFATAPLM